MNARRWAALIITIGLFLVSIVYQIAVTGSADQYDDIFQEKVYEEKIIKEGDFGSKIAVLNLQGVIQDLGEVPFASPMVYNHNHFLKMIESAGSDPLIDGIILKVNTPGGGVVESAEIHEKVMEVQEEYDKPIYVSMGNTAASGGYYVSAPADKIVAHPATLTGSIGVIMESINFAELAENYGVDFNTIKSGEYKDILSASREMTEDEEKILQSMIDEMYEEFAQVIADGRDMPIDTVKKIGDGRVYTGKQAEELDLVDALGSLDDTIEMMEEDYGFDDATVVEFAPGIGLRSMLGFSAKSFFDSDFELQGIVNLLRSTEGPRAMYLYSK